MLDVFIQSARATSSQMDPDVQIGLGILLSMMSDYPKAIDCFETALSKRPMDYILWNKLGATLANSNDPSKAVQAYFNALEIRPTYIRARCNLAIACIQLSQYNEAAEHLITALQIQTTTKSEGVEGVAVQSSTVWNTLKMVVDGYCEFYYFSSSFFKLFFKIVF